MAAEFFNNVLEKGEREGFREFAENKVERCEI